MLRLKFSLKKCYIFLLMAVLPLLIFFIPLYSLTYKDEISEEFFRYNFFDALKQAKSGVINEKVLAILGIIVLCFSFMFLVMFVLSMIFSCRHLQDYKIISTFLCFFNLIASILIIIFVAKICSNIDTGIDGFTIQSKFLEGSVIFLLYSVLIFALNLCSIIFYIKRRENNARCV